MTSSPPRLNAHECQRAPQSLRHGQCRFADFVSNLSDSLHVKLAGKAAEGGQLPGPSASYAA
jgi:hypothetical protein